MRPVDPAVRIRIVQLAEERLPQRVVAERLGVSQMTVSRFERAAGHGRRGRGEQHQEVA